MISDAYLARVNEIADSGKPRSDQLMSQVYAMLDEILVDVFTRPREEWAGALREAGMLRVAEAIEQSASGTGPLA